MAHLIDHDTVRALDADRWDLLQAVCQRHGPHLVPAAYPLDEDGQPVAELNADQVVEVFDAITREFWRQQIEAEAVQAAAEAAACAARDAHSCDPFA